MTKRATYQDVLDAPEHKIAEILDGELFLSPMLAPRVGSWWDRTHADTVSAA